MSLIEATSEFFGNLPHLTEAFTGLFKRGETEEVKSYKPNEQIIPSEEEDGAVQVAPSGFFGTYIDLDNRTKSDNEYITLVRGLSQEPEFDYAVSEIINEMIVIDEDEEPVKIDLEDTELSDTIKDKISKEFDNILDLLFFTSRGYDIVRQWYVDGKLYYHVIIDENNPKKGILELRNVDPRKLKYIKEVEKDTKQFDSDTIIKEKNYFLFNSKGKDSSSGIKIHPDRIIYVHSGLKNSKTGAIVSHLHKAIKRFNQLRLLEESVIIYRFSRAPERRVFYVDIGNMPPKKGEKYVQELMMRYRNKVVYDAQTGQIKDDKKYMSLLEDYWIPKNSAGSGTKIESISGTQLSNGMEDVDNFRKQFYLSLNVPISRLEPESGFSLGRASEISREEVKFARFCTRLRVKFSDLFDEILERQLILKNILKIDDWTKIKQKVKYKYNIDTHFKELLDQEVLQSRLRILQDIEQFTPRAYSTELYPLYSIEWVKKHVLLQTESEIKSMESQMDSEMKEVKEIGMLPSQQMQMEQEQQQMEAQASSQNNQQ
jgi:hypothetical protein